MSTSNSWAFYRKSALTEARPWVPDDGSATRLKTLGISVSDEDTPREGGMIARNQENHNDQWYIAPEYFEANYEPA